MIEKGLSMNEILITITFRESADKEFIINLLSEIKGLAGYVSENKLTDDSYEITTVESSACDYVIRRWQDRGFLQIK